MKYFVSPDGQKLTLTVDDAERTELRDMAADVVQSDKALMEFSETLMANSELFWVDAEHTGDLTSAPIIGILGEPVPAEKPIGVLAGRWPDDSGSVRTHFMPVVKRWAWVRYEVCALLEQLRDSGFAVLVGGPVGA